MAKAPRPGVSRRSQESVQNQEILTLILGDEVRTLAPSLIPLRERTICRKTTGFSPEWWFQRLDVDPSEEAIFVIWWLAGRTTDPGLTYAAAEDDWPVPFDVEFFDIETHTPSLEEVVPDDPEA